MNHVRRAAYLNSNGATFLGIGDNGKAYRSFKASLQTLLQAVLELDVTTGETEVERTPIMDAISRPIPRSRLDGGDAQLSLEADKEGKPYLYNKGLVFYPNTTFTTVDLAFYASIVVFNLVLVHHRKSKNLQDRDLTKLLALYDVVLKLISGSARSGQYDCSHLALVTLNNKSVVHSELGQHAMATRMLYHVWDVMKAPTRRPRLLETWEVEGLFLNIYLMLINAPRVAGAA